MILQLHNLVFYNTKSLRFKFACYFTIVRVVLRLTATLHCVILTKITRHPNSVCLSHHNVCTMSHSYIHIFIVSVCELVYKPEARVEYKACRSIRIVCKVARPVDLNFEVKF